jgi:hypothetical protein
MCLLLSTVTIASTRKETRQRNALDIPNIPGKEMLWNAALNIPETICNECSRFIPQAGGLLSIAIHALALF